MNEQSQSQEQPSQGGERQDMDSELDYATQDVQNQTESTQQLPMDPNEKYKEYQFGNEGRPYDREKGKTKEEVRDDLQKYLKYPEVAQVFDFCKYGKKCGERPMIGKRIKKKGTINKGKYVSFKIPREKSRSIALDGRFQ